MDYYHCLVLPLYHPLLHREAELSGFSCMMHRLTLSWSKYGGKKTRQKQSKWKLCFNTVMYLSILLCSLSGQIPGDGKAERQIMLRSQPYIKL